MKKTRTIMAPQTYEDKVELFFETLVGDDAEIRSSLTLLRKEIKLNFRYRTIWSGVMCVMAGIDLVAKFYCNTDSNKGVGKRFKKYVEDIMGLSSDDADLIYHARNSFMHSFGLFSKEESKDAVEKKYFIHPRFGSDWQFIVRKTWSDGKANHFELGIDTLFKKFEETLPQLKANLLQDRRSNFEELFNKYGTDKPLFEGSNFYDYCNILKYSKRLK